MPFPRLLIRAIVLLAPLGDAAAQAHDHGAATGRLGTVHFETSCRPAVRDDFDRGVALLHSFEFRGAIDAFTRVLAADSSCAMAQWGIALSRWSNPIAPGTRSPAQLAPGRLASEAGQRLAAGATARERAYVAAVATLYDDAAHPEQSSRVDAYERAMALVASTYPADTEATIFHAVALVASAPPTDKSFARQLQAAAIMEPIWARHPDHPGLAHYLIHAYDVPPLAGRARAAAARYAKIAPAASHALHMPSHTFTRLGDWDASIEMNRRSAEAAVRDGAIAEALHASDYMVYAYLQEGRHDEVKRLLDGLPPLAARFDPTAVTGAAPGAAGVFALAAMPARYALERDDWNAAVALVPSASAFPWTEAMVHFARALGAVHLGQLAGAQSSIDSLDAIRERLAHAEPYWAEQVAIQSLGARAWLLHAQGRNDDAVARLREAADREDATEKSAVSPGPLAPARELLGDLLLALRRPADALAAYRATLEREPRRRRAVDGARRAATAAGDTAAAARYAAQLRAITTSARAAR